MKGNSTTLILLQMFLLLCVTDDQQNVPAQTGDTVTLPCQAPRNNILTVKWTTLKLEESDKEAHVWLFRDGHIVPRSQHPDYADRVEAVDSQFKDGNLSISLKTVTRNDTGTYICHYVDGEKRRGNCTVYLDVKDSDQKTVTAQTGGTVTLPCQAPRSNNYTVKWTTIALEESDKEAQVWLFRDGHIVPRSQHPDYADRVEAVDSQFKDGNLSISLKTVTRNDTGTYICHYVDGEKRRGNCTVYLDVKDSGNEMQRTVFIIFAVGALIAAAVGVWFLRQRYPTEQEDSAMKRCQLSKCAKPEPGHYVKVPLDAAFASTKQPGQLSKVVS